MDGDWCIVLVVMAFIIGFLMGLCVSAWIALCLLCRAHIDPPSDEDTEEQEADPVRTGYETLDE